MFERFKKVFAKDAKEAFAPSSQLASSQVSEWAGTRGFAFSERSEGKGFSLEGTVGNKPWRMERGRPSRNFIRGEELRARAELGINEDVAVLVMNRRLKDALEKKAYQLYTDTLQTTADPNLPEEMRWLAMYQEVGWDSIPKPFWERYAVLADERDHALAWLDAGLAGLLMDWPEPGPTAEVPFMLMLLRGKAYLRMECTPSDMPTLEHAATIFTSACEAALGGLSTDISL
ncbi:hypothetical protein [Variovorax terrae]|uniref:Uncharacterized protein n=1 Tax=Variovorax terrae TaxID=2923278 RepID=A0A9X1VWL5_9BURK|nr:hypothetical protein [Variovorax terrae]MCJ0763409.1 hypothetical protein [Variovorax terrae]